ncbi:MULTISPECIES: hypothetical protein [unclassified Microcoleus]|uniref:hypothetical protein n=1 Tax=unclassified Microcoleus TaxID=2642155 RepID=UPI002FCF367F
MPFFLFILGSEFTLFFRFCALLRKRCLPKASHPSLKSVRSIDQTKFVKMVTVAANKTTCGVTVESNLFRFYFAKRYQDSIKEQCLTMYVNGQGFGAIERITGVNPNTVINRVKQGAFSLPDTPDYEELPEVARVR